MTDILHDPTGNRRFWIWVDDHDEDNPIDIDGPDGFKANLDALYGEAVDEYLKLRKKQPYGDLHLDLQTKKARQQRDAMADQFRSRSAVEEMADLIQEWADEAFPASVVMLDKDGLTIPGYEDDETPMVRNMIHTSMALDQLKMTPAFAAYRSADRRTFGKAVALLKGWTDIGEKRRHGEKKVWLVRGEGHPDDYLGPLWVPAPWPAEDGDGGTDDPEIDDLLA
ncbi:hypothetical protein SAMN04488026_108811 [Aliiruegeria lutimaris]|uniref:Virulence-associated protein E-like domain-containing protein n=1 Tax=Aliiruegeria lutimaris TaxID=571298 RepID=A0A1G9KF96_9RHOB|nr:hypothetical protein SAMN04488026_108811 [Aliiruegeria lutimaris]